MTTLVMLAFVIFGIFAYRLLPVAALPRVDFPTITVTALLPGASPETMAASVATPLEKEFSTIAGLDMLTSTSGQGVTTITLQFKLERNLDGAALDVQSALTTAARRLPPEMTTPPSFRKVNPADQPILFLSLASSTLPLSAVNEYAETLIAQRLSTLSGVAQVQVYGVQKYAVRVQVNPEALAARGIGIDEIKAALEAANSNTPVGALSGPAQSFTLQATGQMTRAAEYRPLIVAWRNGAPVRLGDIATVRDSVENDKVASWFNGTRSILLAVQRQPDANTVAVVDSVRALIPIFRGQLPPAVSLNVVNDRSVSIRASVEDVQFTLGLTVALVILVIFLFLRKVTATVIPALALPISIIGTFAGMYVLGYSINNLTLLALTLSVGFVVDDAIVMLENIVRHIETGKRPFQAALEASREIAFTIISITLSLVAVFIPVLFMGGVVGRLFREFAVTISLTILISGFVSLTLTPMLAARMLRPEPHGARHGFLYNALERAFDAMLAAYRVTLRGVLRAKSLTLLLTIGTVVASGWLFAVVPKGFFPTEDTGLLFIVTEAAQDTSFAAMAERQKRVAQIVNDDPNVATANSTVGAIGFSTAINQGRIFIGLKPRDQRKPAEEVVQDLRRKVAEVPGIKVFIQQVQNINLGRLTKSQYQYTLQSGELEELYQWAPKVQARLAELPGFQDVTSDLYLGMRQALVDIDREKAAKLGITAEQVRSTLYSAFGSRQVSTIFTPSNDYAVILEADPRFQQDPAALSRIYVRAASGQLVPLEAFATVKDGVGPLTVSHQGQLPSVTISFNLAPGVSLGDAVNRIQAAEQQIGLPVTIQTGFQGTAQVFRDALAGQGLLLAAAVIVIYIVLGILYESFIHPITILSGLPAAGLGALLTLIWFDMDLSVIAIIGIVMLIGIVKKNAIMMIDFAIERRRAGAAPEAAIYEAAIIRFRPIMMTTMAAIMGALPIALGHGAGAELRQPLGISVVGGLVLSQLLTLYITPVVYIYLEGARGMIGRRRAAAPDAAVAPVPGE
jgi:HAE1 family hydrophobic/amphiphilic exporter-1